MENIRERIVSCAGRVWFCAKELLKWLALAMITGVPCGIIGAAFDLAVEHVTELRTEHTAILFLLPVIGLVIVAFYKAAKLEGVSTDDIIDCVKDGKPIRFWLLPVMFISTVLTHLGGGSAGREGAALQMGGTIGWWAGGVLHLNEHERRMAVQCGMAAFFSALFSTPLAATFFAMTIVNVGVVFYAAYIPCFTAAIIAYGVAQLIGVTPTRFAVEAPAFEPAMVVRVVLLALACAVVVHLFCFALHSAAHGLPKLLPNPWVRVFLGGCVVVLFTLLYGDMRYNGAGVNIIAAAVEQGQALPWDWIIKILLTALTLGVGFKGGEVVPSFFVGATFGCVAAPLLGIPAGFGAALGLAGVFCGASNCVVASLVLAIELFGAQGLWYFAIVCGITYALSGYAGLYHSQLFLTDKLEPEYRIIRGHNHHSNRITAARSRGEPAAGCGFYHSTAIISGHIAIQQKAGQRHPYFHLGQRGAAVQDNIHCGFQHKIRRKSGAVDGGGLHGFFHASLHIPVRVQVHRPARPHFQQENAAG